MKFYEDVELKKYIWKLPHRSDSRNYEIRQDYSVRVHRVVRVVEYEENPRKEEKEIKRTKREFQEVKG